MKEGPMSRIITPWVMTSDGPQTQKIINPLTPNDHYTGRTAPLTCKRCILYIYSTNIGAEYFKHGIYSQFFSSSKCSLFHNSNACFLYYSHFIYSVR